MRKLAVVLFALASLCLMVVPAMAAKGDMAFGVNGGIAMPMGQLADEDYANMKLGYGGGLFFDYMVTKEIALGVDGSYTTMSNQDNSDVKAKTMQYGVQGKYFIPTGGKLVPYVDLGLSMYNRKVEFSDGGISIDASDNKFGMHGGVGADYLVTPMVGIGVNGAYHYTFGEFSPEDLTGGLDDWNFISFNAVVTFHFPKAK